MGSLLEKIMKILGKRPEAKKEKEEEMAKKKVKFEYDGGRKVAVTPYGVNIRCSATENVLPDTQRNINLNLKCDRPMLLWSSEALESRIREGLEVRIVGMVGPVLPANTPLVVTVANKAKQVVSFDAGETLLCATILDGSDLEIVES